MCIRTKHQEPTLYYGRSNGPSFLLSTPECSLRRCSGFKLRKVVGVEPMQSCWFAHIYTIPKTLQLCSFIYITCPLTFILFFKICVYVYIYI